MIRVNQPLVLRNAGKIALSVVAPQCIGSIYRNLLLFIALEKKPSHGTVRDGGISNTRNSMESKIREILIQSVDTKKAVIEDEALLSTLSKVSSLLKSTSSSGGTVYLCGNGGSACDAMHFCEELVARFKRERPGIRAMHFMDPSTLTCWGNDYDFESVFKRQAETFCSDKDVLVCLSTSGNSQNILQALEAAKERSCTTVLFTGKDGGAGAKLADHSLIVPSNATERIQEVHITFVHILCELLECES